MQVFRHEETRNWETNKWRNTWHNYLTQSLFFQLSHRSSPKKISGRFKCKLGREIDFWKFQGSRTKTERDLQDFGFQARVDIYKMHLYIAILVYYVTKSRPKKNKIPTKFKWTNILLNSQPRMVDIHPSIHHTKRGTKDRSFIFNESEYTMKVPV